jgi:hypothetical protein
MTIAKKDILLPPGVQAVGLTEEQVARLWGISPAQFAELRRHKPDLVPKARRIGGRKVYSYNESVEKFHQLPWWDDDESGVDADTDDEWGVN